MIALSLVAACADGNEPSGLERGKLEIAEGVVRLVPGSQRTLTLDAGGTDVSWQVRHARVASVDAGGVVRALSPGMTWALASDGRGRDSVRVIVSFAEAPAGTIAFSLGTEQNPLRLAGVSRVVRHIEGPTLTTSITASVAAEQPAELMLEDFFTSADTMVVIQLRGEPATGLHEITPWQVIDGGDGRFRLQGAEGALVWTHLPDRPNHYALYVPVTPLQVEIDESSIPAAVGPATGRLAGRVGFDAVGLLVRVDHEGTRVVGQVSQEVTQFFAEFDLTQRIQPLGRGRLTVTGGPTPLEAVNLFSPQIGVWNGGLVVNAATLVRQQDLFFTQLWVGSPAIGEFAFTPLHIEELVGRSALTTGRTWAWTESGTVADGAQGPLPNLALSQAGVLRIIRYEAPGSETWGLLEAELETQQNLVFGGEQGAQQTVTLELLAPVAPSSRYVYPHTPNIASDAVLPPGSRRIGNGPLQLPGRVVETSVHPVVDMEIRLTWADGSATVRTNEQGEFLFTGVHPGDYEIEFTAPAGYGLARGQRTPVGPLSLSADRPLWIPISLSDAEGNGGLQVIAGSSGTNTTVSGVVARIRRTGTDEVVKTMTTGEVHPHSGLARTKLQPGRYAVDFELPPGYRFLEGQASTVEVEVFVGHQSFIPVGVIRN